MRKLLKTALLALPVLIVASCSSAKFTAYQDDTVVQGQNGIARSYDGIQIWTDGTPDRKYKVIGVLNDNSGNAHGFVGGVKELTQRSLDSELASEAKAHGGDAVIILQGGQERSAFGNSGSNPDVAEEPGFGADDSGGNKSAIHGQPLKALIVKYVSAP